MRFSWLSELVVLLINLLMLALTTSLNRSQSHSGGFTEISSPLHTEQELRYALPLTGDLTMFS